MQSVRFGTLYVVATPIGNLKDMTLRAIEVLSNVNLIAAEDTRHANLLLKHYSISKPTISMHAFNERERLNVILNYLKEGETIAYISDAGTPLISDPGFLLIREAKISGITVVPIPGPCAAIAALSAAGLPCDKFVFEGFLPAKEMTRVERLRFLNNETRTLIFYEAPHRLMEVLLSMQTVFGLHRKAVVARELTKIHESILMQTLASLTAYYALHASELRGEIVIVVQGQEEERQTKEVNTEEVLTVLLTELPIKQAAALASKITGERKNVLYEIALKMKAMK